MRLLLVTLTLIGLSGCGSKSDDVGPSPQVDADNPTPLEAFERLSKDADGNRAILSLNGTQVSDAELQHLEGMNFLTGLRLDETQVSDAGLEHLKALTNLESLWLDGTQVSDSGLEHLKGMTNWIGSGSLGLK